MFTCGSYQKQDLRDVILLVDRNIDEKYSPGIYDELSASWPEGFVLCKDDKGVLTGLIFALPTSEGYARIIIFCVQNGFRNMGLGGMLLEEEENRAHTAGFKVLKLEVRTSNHNAIEFYKKRGFTISGTLTGFYNDGGDAYSMVKFI